MPVLSLAFTVTASACLVFFVIGFFQAALFRDKYLWYWTASWALNTLLLLVVVANLHLPETRWMIPLRSFLALGGIYFISLGNFLLTGHSPPRWWPLGLVLVGGYTALVFEGLDTGWWLTVPISLLMGYYHLAGAWVLLNPRKNPYNYFEAKLAGVFLLICGLLRGSWFLLAMDRQLLSMAILILCGCFVLIGSGLLLLHMRISRKNLEDDRLRLRAEIAQKERVQSDLVQLSAGLAHNLNNAMMAMGTNVQAAYDRLGQDPDHRNIKGLLQNALRAGQGARGITKRLSAYVFGDRLLESEYRQVDLTALLQNIADMVPTSFSDMAPKEQTLETSLEPDLWIKADPEQLIEVFLNLLKNAMEANTAGGLIRLSAQRENGKAKVSVTDQGPGLEPGLEKRVFEPFFSTKGENGMGLGLTLSRRTVREMGGDITMRNQDQGGARVTVSLPLTAKSQTPSMVPEPIPGEFKTRRVLLVEDEVLVALGTKSALEAAGHSVHVARSLAEARELLDKLSFDALVCDLHLPDGTGWDVLEIFSPKNSQAPGPRLVPLLLSGFVGDQPAPPAPKGKWRYRLLEKPVSAEVILGHLSAQNA